MTIGLRVSLSAIAVLLTYAESLLKSVRSLIDQGEYSIAIVAAHIACEVSAERAFSRAFAAKGIASLEEPVEDLLPGFNLANERVRKLYNALSGVEIEKQPFWQAFKASATRRNKVVHNGLIAEQAHAEDSYKAACDLVAFLK
jgi:hypothetical protein